MMKNEKDKKGLSKHMSWLLRHNLVDQVDAGGWVDVDVFADICMQTDWIHRMCSGQTETFLEYLHELVQADSKQRFQLTQHKIRCCQGHSISHIDPKQLYEKLSLEQSLSEQQNSELPGIVHATQQSKLKDISLNGLKSMSRISVHFATRKHHLRAGCNCFLQIDVEKWYSAGHCLYRANNGVLLSDQDVAWEYLKEVSLKQ